MIYRYSVQKILDYASWGFIAVLALPTVMIIASWNSVPGDLGYGVKRAFESALLVMARPSYDAEASLNAQYTKRRMEEAKALLANNQSSAGLSQLSAQITATKKMIDRAPTQEKKKEAAKQYITTLQGVSKELKAQQLKSRTTAAKPATNTRRRQMAAATSGDQLQANLQMQLEQVQALQQQLQQQVQSQPQSQQLLSQLAAQAQQLRQLQQQVAQTGSQTIAETQEQIAQISEQLNASQDQTQTIVEQITTPTDAQESQDEAIIDISLNNTDEQIQDTIEELENIAEADSNLNQNINTLMDQLNDGDIRRGNRDGDDDDGYDPAVLNNLNNNNNNNNNNGGDDD